MSAAEKLALSVQEACEELGVGRSTFYELILPDLKHVKLGRRTLIARVELERWLDRNGAVRGA
jgi:excisionase family DNA binding protein